MTETPDIYHDLQLRGCVLQGKCSLQLREEKLCCFSKPSHRRGDESNDATGCEQGEALFFRVNLFKFVLMLVAQRVFDVDIHVELAPCLGGGPIFLFGCFYLFR